MKLVFNVLLALLILSANAQTETSISVYDCVAAIDPPPQSYILNGSSTFRATCVNLTHPDNYWFNQSYGKTISAVEYIHADETCHVGPFSGNGNMHWTIAPSTTDFDVALMNYLALDDVEKLKKLELGIEIPEGLLTKIYYFINDADVSEELKINPFVDWDLDVEAYFFHSGYGESQFKEVDGFFYRDYERDTLADDWNEVATNYPFRVRFTPPFEGIYQCQIQIKVNGVPTYFAEPFSFYAQNSSAHGYVQVHENHRNLELDDRIIMPVGQNFPYPVIGTSIYNPALGETHKAAPPSAWAIYHQQLSNYHDIGGKYVRISQSAPSSLIEFEKKGNYYDRLHYAWETDKYIAYCDEHDMLVNFNMLFQEPLMVFGQYETWWWDFSHYKWNSATQEHYFDPTDPFPTYCYNDSPLVQDGEYPHNMFLDEDDIEYHKQRTRYYISRYGYSTSIMQFELLSEPYHLDEFFNPSDASVGNDYSNSYEWRDTPKGDTVRAAMYNYNNVISNYIKYDMKHDEHLIGLHAYDNSIFGLAPDYLNDLSCEIPSIDVIGLSKYQIEPNRFFISGNGGLGSDDIDPGENSYYKKTLFFHENFDKPLIYFEQGSVGYYLDNSIVNDCSDHAVHSIDVKSIGFTGCAGFFPWEGYFPGQDVAWPYTIAAEQWMNNDPVINVLSAGNGGWYQGRQAEKISVFDDERLKETQYYLDLAKENGVGFVLNRTHNFWTHSNGSCNLPFPGTDFSVRTDIQWNDGPNLVVRGLDAFTQYEVKYFDFLNGNEIYSHCFGTSTDDKLKLEFPMLDGDDLPLVWFTLNKVSGCGSGMSQNETVSEIMSTDELMVINEEINSFAVFPNPFFKSIMIVTNEEATFCITDTDNKIIQTGILYEGTNEVYLDAIAKGVYYLRVASRPEDIIKLVKL